MRWPDGVGEPAGSDGSGGLQSAAAVVPKKRGLSVFGFGARPKMELLWDSPAAAGHNRKTVFRVALTSEGDRKAARALDASLSQS